MNDELKTVEPNPAAKKKKKIFLKRWWFWVLVVFVIIIAASNSDDSSQTTTASGELAPKTEATAKTDERAKDDIKVKEDRKAKEEAKAKEAEAKTKEKEEKAKNPSWNKNETDAMKNGNIFLAVDMIKAIKEIPVGEATDPAIVIKTPWNYYGKPISFTGSVAVVEDFPPGSDQGKAGIAADVVLQTNDGTIVEFFSMVPSGDIKENQQLTVTGYPVGRTEVDNKLGGKFTHLIVVTNNLK